MKPDSKLVDAALAAVMRESGSGRFTVADVLQRLEVLPEDLEAESMRLERELDADENLFKDEEAGLYVLRDRFFTGREFIVTPNEIEIENNILFPGHRFCPFCSEKIFPSEIRLSEAGNNRKIKLREFFHDVTELMPCHILLGSEQIFDYFVADNPENKVLLTEKTKRRQVCLNVFDLENFYAEHEFTSGDALLVKIGDWRKGNFSFTYLSGTERRSAKVKEWINELGRALETVIDRFGEYLEIPDQLRWAFFLGDDLLRGGEAGSLDEFYLLSERIEVCFANASHTVLARKLAVSNTDGEDFELPENIGISRGRVSSLQELLEDVNSPLNALETDAYIISYCYQNNVDFDHFFRHCFGWRKLSFADDAQEVIFLNYLEDRWETLFAEYNPQADAVKAPLREQVLEYIDERLELFENLGSMDINPEQLPETRMKKIAEIGLYFTGLLEVLNSESHTLSADDAEEIAEAVGRMGEIQNEQIAGIHSYLNF
ncbi:MAG: hypothetical protein PHV59_06800 [Victivallales bacterium]|nr:hypothetical protein [Victivallales bacterium]